MFEVVVCPSCGYSAGDTADGGPCRHVLRSKNLIEIRTGFESEMTLDEFYLGKFNNRVVLKSRIGLVTWVKCRILSQGFFSRIFDTFPPQSKLLELGCSAGVDLFGERFRMVGLDTNIVALRESNYEVAVKCVFSDTLPFKTGCFDGVVSSFFFEHLDKSMQERCLAESARVLNDRGQILFLFDIKSRHPIIRRWEADKPESFRLKMVADDGHLGLMELEDALAMLSRHFNIQNIEFNEVVIPSYSMMKKILADYGWLKFFPGGSIFPIIWNCLVLFCDRCFNFVPNHYCRTIMVKCIKK